MIDHVVCELDIRRNLAAKGWQAILATQADVESAVAGSTVWVVEELDRAVNTAGRANGTPPEAVKLGERAWLLRWHGTSAGVLLTMRFVLTINEAHEVRVREHETCTV